MKEPIEIIRDLLTEFDEMGFVPTTTVPDPVAYAIKWREKLTKTLIDLQKQNEWISVEERLPEKEGEYLVLSGRGDVSVCNFVDIFGNGEYFCFDIFNVAYWIPFPELPKTEGGE